MGQNHSGGVYGGSGTYGGASDLAGYYKKYAEKYKLNVPDGFQDNANSMCSGDVKGGVIGGYDDLQKYGDSLYSAAKEKLIRDIAEEVFSALKLQGAKYAKTAPISDIIKHLAKIIPNPKNKKMFHDSFNKNPGKQQEVCQVLATAINKNYGSNMIDTNASPGKLCNSVAEVMASLFTGLHTEFMSVAGDVTRILNNLQTLDSYIDASYRKQVEIAQASGDAELKERSKVSEELYKRLKEELERQMAMISNLINVTINPTTKALVSLLEDNKDFTGMVYDIKDDIGSVAFGDKLAYLLSGVSSVAFSADLIDKALKKIGMSVSDFKNAKNAQDLRLKIYNHIGKKNPNSKELDAMMAAAEVIYKNNYSHDAVAKLLEKKGGCDCVGGDDEKLGGDPSNDEDMIELTLGGEDDDEKLGGFADDSYEQEDSGLPQYWNKKGLETKIKKKIKYRKMLFADFKKILKAWYQKIVDSANNISSRFGKEIPISDDLDRFVKIFCNLASLNRDNIHIALSGWAKDVVSKEKRDQFMNNYELVIVSIDPLIKGSGGQYFSTLQSSIKGLLGAIDDFSNKIVKALSEIHVDNPVEIKQAIKQSSNAMFGASQGGGGDDLFGGGSFTEFDKVKNEMKYYYSIANIKTNLSRVSEDIQSFGDDYDQILGEEAGWLISQIDKEYNSMVDKSNPNGGTNEIATAITNSAATPEEKTACYKNLCNLWKYQRDAKKKLVEVAQAVDLYLRAFADGIAKDPDTIVSVVKMLDQVEIVAKWFNERSGDNLAALFEAFPCGVSGANPIYSNGANGSIAPNDGRITLYNDGTHYYSYLEGLWTSNSANLPGNPFIGIPTLIGDAATKLKSVRELSEKTIKSMRALENILSAFSTVGNKLGNLDVQSKTFMTPGQMFNGLCQYISASAFTNDFLPTHATLSSGIYRDSVSQRGIMNNDTKVNTTIPSNANPTNYRLAGSGGRLAYNTNDLVYTDSICRSDHAPGNGISPAAGIAAGVYQATGNITTPAGNTSTPTTEFGIRVGPGNNSGAGADIAQKRTAIAMSAIPFDSADNFWVYHDMSTRYLNDDGEINIPNMRIDTAGYSDRFYDTDLLFLLTLKSIVCKIFTAVDCYRLFHRPTIDRYYSHSLNPLRTILGGAEGDDDDGTSKGGEDGEDGTSKGGEDGGSLSGNFIKVIPEAIELYFRLPLLAEWYRETFSFKKGREVDARNGNWQLSIVPAIDGTWSGFVRVLFDQASYVSEGNYTEFQIRKMVEELNHIYRSYKSRYPNSTIRNIINSFVIEMNRIFGFIKQSEINAYLEDRRNTMDGKINGTNIDYDRDDIANFLDYDILDAEDQFGSNPAPSDKFANVNNRIKRRKDRSMVHLQEEIVRIRKKIDIDFLNATRNDQDTSHSFIETLRNYKKSLDNTKSDRDAYEIVVQMIQGSNKLVHVSADKLIMVHETVAAPLAVLYNIYKVMAQYNAFLHGTSIKNIKHLVACRAAANAGQPWNGIPAITIAPVAADFNDNTTARTVYEALLRLVPEYKDNSVKDMYYTQFVNAFCPLNLSNVNDMGIIDPTGGAIPLNTDFPGNPINYLYVNFILQSYLSNILDISSAPNKLIQCNVSDIGHVNMDWSNLQELSVGLLAQVKSNINKLRINFNDEGVIFSKYEDRKYPGSVNWLEENLVEILFNDRDRCGLNVAHSEHLPSTLKALLAPATNPPTLDSFNTSAFVSFATMIYYNPEMRFSLNLNCTTNNLTDFPFNIAPILIDNPNQHESNILNRLKGNQNIIAGVPPTLAITNRILSIPVLFFTRLCQLKDFGFSTYDNNSLVFSFNNILRHYMKDNFDNSAQKIYTPLLENFMNSAGAKEMLQNQGIPDIGTRVVRPPIGTDNLDDMQQPDAGANSIFDIGAGNPIQSIPDETVLFASHGIIAKALVNSIDMKLKKKKYAYESFVDVPDYMKDRMKANLPYYSKLFEMIFSRASLLQKLLTNTSAKNNISTNFAAEDAPNHLDVRASRQTYKILGISQSDAMFVYLNGLLNRLTSCAMSIKKCCDNVYKELQDTAAYFMEVNKDFISDYKSRNGCIPLMPASDFLLPQVSLNSDNSSLKHETNYVWLPTNLNGSDRFKYNYASRLVMRNDIEPQIEHFPGAKDIYNSYASVATQKGGQISPQEYANTIKLMIKLSKFLNEGTLTVKLFSSQVEVHPLFSLASVDRLYLRQSPMMEMLNEQQTLLQSVIPVIDDQVIAAAAAPAPGNIALLIAISAYEIAAWNASFTNVGHIGAAPLANANVQVNRTTIFSDNVFPFFRLLSPYIYQYASRSTNSLAETIELTENPNNPDSKNRIASLIGTVSENRNTDRKRMRIFNILDLNIVPINVHAFMREVPFVNILNYSYTFDRMVHDFVLPSYMTNQIRAPNGLTSDTLMIKPNNPVTSTRELMVKLLTYPYANLALDGGGAQYYALLASLFNGNDNLNLGRPRYLSDQLWHKVLLTSSAQLVAGQRIFNSNILGQYYQNDMAPMESGPAAYESVRSVVRYGAPYSNTTDTFHSRTLSEPIYVLWDQVVPAIERYLNSLPGNNLIFRSGETIMNFSNMIPNNVNFIDNAIAEILYPLFCESNPYNLITNLTNGSIRMPEQKLNILIINLFYNGTNINFNRRRYTEMLQMGQDNPHNNPLLFMVQSIIEAIPVGAAHAGAPNINGAAIANSISATYIATLAAIPAVPAANNDLDADLRRQRSYSYYLNGANNRNTAAANDLFTGVSRALNLNPGPPNANNIYFIADYRRIINNLVQINVANPEARIGVSTLSVIFSSLINYLRPQYATNQLPNCIAVFNTYLHMRLNGLNNAQALANFYAAPSNFAAVRDMNNPAIAPGALTVGINQNRLNVLRDNTGAARTTLTQYLTAVFGARMRKIGYMILIYILTYEPAPAIAGETVSRRMSMNLINGLCFITYGLPILRLLLSGTNPILLSLYNGLGSNGLSSYLTIPSGPVSTPGLKFWDRNTRTWTVRNQRGQHMNAADAIYCAALGKIRFDTKLVRNLTWMVQLQRIMRVILINQVSWIDTPVIKGLKIMDSHITEYEGNEQFTSDDFNGSRYDVI